jgi:hypothetical protein
MMACPAGVTDMSDCMPSRDGTKLIPLPVIAGMSTTVGRRVIDPASLLVSSTVRGMIFGTVREVDGNEVLAYITG